MREVKEAVRSFFNPILKQAGMKLIQTDPGNILIAIGLYYVAEAIIACGEIIAEAIRGRGK